MLFITIVLLSNPYLLYLIFHSFHNIIKNINFSMKHILITFLVIFFENIFLMYFTNRNIPSINHTPIILVISYILTYMIRHTIRTYSIYQSLVHLYHPEDKYIYLYGHYYTGFFYHLIDACIKLFICFSIIDMNYYISLIYLSMYHNIESYIYYSKMLNTSPEYFKLVSNYIFRKLNE